MRFDQMTIKLQEAFSSSQALCVSAQQQSLECEHLLLSLFKDSGSIASTLVKRLGVDYEQLLRELEEQIANAADEDTSAISASVLFTVFIMSFLQNVLS